MSEGSDEVKRWTARRKAAVVLDILKGKTTATKTVLLNLPRTFNDTLEVANYD